MAKNDKSMIGFILNKSLDRNYSKIKNLSSLLANQEPKKIYFVSDTNYADMAIRQHVLPMTRNRIVKVYFTTKRCLYLESFDSQGNCLKSMLAFENLSSFPICYGYGDYFCLSFTAKNYNYVSIFDSNQTYLLLFNSDLVCLKKINKFTSIESLYMNEKNIFLFYAHKTTSCCEILDYDLNELESFGQQNDPDKEFYMERTNIAWKEQSASGLKNNPRIFGYTDSSIYFLT